MSALKRRKPTKRERQVRTVIAMFHENSEQDINDIRAQLRLRMADDHQSIMADVIDSAPFEVVYVWWRPGIWTCAPTEEVRLVDAYELAKQDATKWERRKRRQIRFRRSESLTGTLRQVAAQAKATLDTLAANLPDPNAHDPCLARIDRKRGMASSDQDA